MLKKNLFAVLCAALMALVPTVASAAYTGLPSGFDGGGFCGVIAVHPTSPDYLVTGHDAGGIHISPDGGKTWMPANSGFDDRHQLIVASLAFSVKTSAGKNILYAATGRALTGTNQEGGGFMVSYDEGLNWQRTNARNAANQPRFSGTGSPDAPPADDENNSSYAVPREHPRSTGNLIALDESNDGNNANDFIFVATYRDGVMRSNDGGVTWTALGLSGKRLRTLVLSPDKTTLWAGAYGKDTPSQGGVYSLANPSSASANPTWTFYSSAPLNTEELRFIGSSSTGLWAVGSDGPWYSSSAKAVVAKINNSGVFVNKLVINQTTGAEVPVGLTTASKASFHTSFYSIDGYFPGGGAGSPIVYAGIWEGGYRTDGSGKKLYQSIWRSQDGGSTWDCITDSDSTYVHDTLFDATGDQWWLAAPKPETQINGSTYTPSLLLVVTNGSQRTLFSAGRSGLWLTRNGTATRPDWYPAVANMNATFHSSIVVDGAGSNDTIYTSDADWAVIYSTDAMGSVKQNPPVGTGYTGGKNLEDQGLCLALDANPNLSTRQILYAGIGSQRSNLAGNLYLSTNGTASGSWVAVGGTGNNLKDVTPGQPWASADPDSPDASFKKRPVAVAAGRNAAGTRAVVIAAVQGAGIWRISAPLSSYPTDKGPNDPSPGSNWGTWTQAAAPTDAGLNNITDTNEKTARLWWPAGSKYVYFLDRVKGLYRSSDYGQSWALIWNTAAGGDSSGYLIGTSEDVVYVSHQDGNLYKLTNAHLGSSVGSGITATTVTFVTSGTGTFTPGPIAVDAGGKLHVTAAGTSNTGVYEARLYVATTSANTAFVDQSDFFYKGEAKWPTDLAVGRTSSTAGQKGNAYVPTQGQGVTIAIKP